MENTQEQKTPEQWFQMLKEPYRSKAIKAIDISSILYKAKVNSLDEAVYCIDFAKYKEFAAIYVSLNAGETTYLEPETLKPEQMESGKWYVVTTKLGNYITQFDRMNDNLVIEIQGYSKVSDSINSSKCLCKIGEVKSIRHATKEEVLKYFPDEVFEPTELRPEDLVSGNVYTLVNTEYDRRFTFIHKHYDSDSANPILYTKMYAHHLKEFYYNSCFSLRLIKISHATPEEKKLLLGEEEPTDWEAKYNELKAKYDQLEPKGEKVYFYFNEKELLWLACTNEEFAIEFSKNNHPIYEAVCIGKKKSVLVNE